MLSHSKQSYLWSSSFFHSQFLKRKGLLMVTETTDEDPVHKEGYLTKHNEHSPLILSVNSKQLNNVKYKAVDVFIITPSIKHLIIC